MGGLNINLVSSYYEKSWLHLGGRRTFDYGCISWWKEPQCYACYIHILLRYWAYSSESIKDGTDSPLRGYSTETTLMVLNSTFEVTSRPLSHYVYIICVQIGRKRPLITKTKKEFLIINIYSFSFFLYHEHKNVVQDIIK